MKKTKILIVVLMMLLMLVGCHTQAQKVSYNISQQANNFNVTRRLAVINARTHQPLFELIGNFSLQNNSHNELEIIVEVGPGVYKKHFIYLNEYTMYVVEDISGAFVDKYHYEVNFLPEMLIPFTITSND